MRSSKRLIAAAILAMLVYGMVAAVLGTLLPSLAGRFRLGSPQIGNIASLQAAGLVISSIVIGPLIEMFGKKLSLLLGLALITVGLVLFASGSAFHFLMFSMLLIGLGSGMVVTGANSLISDISAQHRSSALNLLNLFFGLGGFLTPLLAAYWFPGNAFHVCFLLAALTGFTLLLHAATAMPAPTHRHSFHKADLPTLNNGASLIILCLFLFCYVACEVGVWNWLAQYLIGQNIPEQTALLTVSFGFALGILAGRLIATFLLLHIASIDLLLVCSLLMAVTTWGILQVHESRVAGVLVFSAGFSMAPVFPTTLAIIGGRFPKLAATAMGLAITCGWIGSAVSSSLIGALAGESAAGLKTGLLLLPALSGLMIVMNVLLRFNSPAFDVPPAPRTA